MEDGAAPAADVRPAGAAARLAALFRRMGGAALDAAYPPQCLACREIVAAPASLCPTCWRGMPFISRPFCERLGTPFAVDLGAPLLSPAAIADPPVFRRARAVARYDGAARELIHKLKYADRQELAVGMGRLMRGAAAESLAEVDAVVPVPLHWTRLWTRRFNQAAALGRVVAAEAGLPLETGWLRRRKRTIRQVGLSRDERRRNLQGAFVVPDEALTLVRGRRVLLVDDVLTTAATANAAARALMKGGAEAVDIVTFARVVTAA
jgi:ComF family protein